jgi:hypothetical protein
MTARHRPLLARCWELRDNLTVYDASYVALAEALDLTLLTGDGRLARAPALRCHVEILRPASLSGASPSFRAITPTSDPPSSRHVMRPPPLSGTLTAMNRQSPGRSLRRFGLILGAGAFVIILAATAHRSGSTRSFPAPSKATLAGLSLPRRIAAIAKSQVGYSTDPSNSYCNKYSAYWDAGTQDCPAGEADEEWCADFAAWAWRKAGAHFTYGYAPGEINGAAVSFYEWGIANGTWHPAGSGYVAEPGDVAVYGLSLGADPSAVHVAIVTGDAPGQRGPDVVNGDGDRTGFSVVEIGTDQVRADTGQHNSVLAGYVSPPP